MMFQCGGDRCLKDGELIKSFRASDSFKNYRVKGEIMRRTATIDFANRTEGDLQDQGWRDQFPSYLMPISRIAQNEFNGQHIPNWGWQIRMVIHEECRKHRIAMAETGEMDPIEHVRWEIDQIDMVNAMLVIRMRARVIGVIMMKNLIIRTIMGISQTAKCY